MAKYIDKQGNIIEAELFKEGMEDCWTLSVSGGYRGEWKDFKSKKSAEDFIKNNKGPQFLTKMGDLYFNADKINYTLYIGFGESIIHNFGEHYIINSPNGKILESKTKFEKKYKPYKSTRTIKKERA